jgi:hypothetical protein
MASVAVFLVLGGATAVAAKKITGKQLQANSVTTAKLKKNAVTASKIKKNAITTTKIAKDAVTGDKVNESTLGQVPSAVTANTATTAGSASSLAGYKPFGVFVPAGTRTIAAFGPFTIKGECVINNGGTDEGRFLLFTSVNGGAMDDNNGDEFTPFDIADSPADLYDESTTTGNEDIEVSEEPGLTAVAPGGPTVFLQNETIGFNIAGHPGQCYFAGVALQG